MHKEYIRILSDSPLAVLFVHGIIGTPDHFKELIPLLPENMTVVNLLLDGHGGSVSDFAHSSMEKWKSQVDRTLTEIEENYKAILVVGHSMGTLLLMDALPKHKKIKGMFLLASPLVLGPKPIAAINALKVIFGKVEPDDILAKASQDSCSINLERNLLKYISWLPRYYELYRESHKARKNLMNIHIPCTVLQSEKDELVSTRSCKFINRNPCIRLETLPDSRHFYYSAPDFETLKNEFQRATAKFIGTQKPTG